MVGIPRHKERHGARYGMGWLKVAGRPSTNGIKLSSIGLADQKRLPPGSPFWRPYTAVVMLLSLSRRSNVVDSLSTKPGPKKITLDSLTTRTGFPPQYSNNAANTLWLTPTQHCSNSNIPLLERSGAALDRNMGYYTIHAALHHRISLPPKGFPLLLSLWQRSNTISVAHLTNF